MKDTAYGITIHPKYDRYQRGLSNMVYKFFDQKIGSGVNLNEVLAQELHKPVIKKFKRRKVYVRFQYNIWAADLAEMRSLSSKDHLSPNILGLKCAIDAITKYAWVKFLKDKKSITVLHGFIEIVNES